MKKILLSCLFVTGVYYANAQATAIASNATSALGGMWGHLLYVTCILGICIFMYRDIIRTLRYWTMFFLVCLFCLWFRRLD
jgi:hypothetical protein